MPFVPERLDQLMQEHALSQQDLAQQVGISQGMISDYRRGKKQPGRAVLERLDSALGVSVDYLIGLADVSRRASGRFPLPNAHPVGLTVQLPVYGSIRAGAPLLMQDQIIGWEPVPVEDIRGGEYFYLQVVGDSMKDAHIINGSLVLVRRQEQVDNGDIAVVLVNDEEATIKRVKMSNGQVILYPANPQEIPTLHDARDVRILGKVLETKIKL
jgi:repressor LexA